MSTKGFCLTKLKPELGRGILTKVNFVYPEIVPEMVQLGQTKQNEELSWVYSQLHPPTNQKDQECPNLNSIKIKMTDFLKD